MNLVMSAPKSSRYFAWNSIQDKGFDLMSELWSNFSVYHIYIYCIWRELYLYIYIYISNSPKFLVECAKILGVLESPMDSSGACRSAIGASSRHTRTPWWQCVNMPSELPTWPWRGVGNWDFNCWLKRSTWNTKETQKSADMWIWILCNIVISTIHVLDVCWEVLSKCVFVLLIWS